MADQTQPAEPTQEQKDAGFVMHTIAGAVTSSLDAMAQRNQVANAALMGLTTILAAMPETAQLRPERVAAVLGVVLGNNTAMQQEVANFITGVINTAREVPKAMAAAEAAYLADQAKAGNAGAKPN